MIETVIRVTEKSNISDHAQGEARVTARLGLIPMQLWQPRIDSTNMGTVCSNLHLVYSISYPANCCKQANPKNDAAWGSKWEAN